MHTVNNFSGKSDYIQKKIWLTGIALIGLMVLFPPKIIYNTNPIMDVTQTQSAGYQFLLSDPSAEEKKAGRVVLGDDVDKYIGSHIEWSKLLIQLVIVAGGVVIVSRYLPKPQPQ